MRHYDFQVLSSSTFNTEKGVYVCRVSAFHTEPGQHCGEFLQLWRVVKS